MALGFSVPADPNVMLLTTRTAIRTVANTAGFFYVVKALLLCNFTTSPVTVTLYKDDGASSDQETSFKDIPIAAKQTITFTDLWILGPNQQLAGLCSATPAVSASVSGWGKLS